jgi:hypothetical protein
MDEFEIVSEVGKGTTVTMWKWRNDNDKRTKNSHIEWGVVLKALAAIPNVATNTWCSRQPTARW